MGTRASPCSPTQGMILAKQHMSLQEQCDREARGKNMMLIKEQGEDNT
jgi:hypothetical protein